MKKILSILITGILLVNITNAQDVEYKPKQIAPAKLTLTFEPGYLFMSGLKLNLSYNAGKGNWITLSPVFYGAMRDTSNYIYEGDRSYHKLLGYGIELGHKVFLFHDIYGERAKGFYFKYDFKYTYFNIKKNVYAQFENPDNSYSYRDGEENSKIGKVGGDIILGFQLSVKEKLFFDFYTGVGIRYSTFSSNTKKAYRYNTNVWDFGYTGIVPVFGVRIGVGLM